MSSDNPNDHFTKLGTFNISPTRKVAGELCWKGEDSYLYLGDDHEFHDTARLNCITGYLHDLKKVTLIDCVGMDREKHFGLNDFFYTGRYFPHYIITGQSYFDVQNDLIDELSFGIEDFDVLFHDFDAFSTHLDESNLVSEIIKSQKLPYAVEIGEYPIVAYYTGKSIITQIETILGVITIRHQPSFGSGGSEGVSISNRISISIKPSTPIKFKTATNHILDLLKFFEIVVGRAQKINNFILHINQSMDPTNRFNVYWSFAPGSNRSARIDKRVPSSHDILISPIQQESEFNTVLANWLAGSSDRRSARGRFSNSYLNADYYSVDRLISAANMFDILPSSAVPKDEELPAELISAKNQCVSIFTPLPDSYERNSILSALGRIGKCTLKHKIRFRLEYINKRVGNKLPDIQLVADEAINCRNYYVHGSKTKIDYSKNADLSSFFTDTLEFIFAASELVEAGWNINEWINKPTSMTHPFGHYKVEYAEKVAALKKVLQEPSAFL